MRVSFTPSSDLFPFTSHWFDHEVGRVHYIDEGRGLPILFLHGNPTWSFLYREIVKRLRNRFRCVAADYPGLRLSDRGSRLARHLGSPFLPPGRGPLRAPTPFLSCIHSW